MKDSKNKPSHKNAYLPYILAASALVIIAIIGLVFFQPSNPLSPTIPTEISVVQAVEKQTQGAFLLDVRQPEEWVQFHIPGSTLIPLGDLPNRLSEIPKNRYVVVVCRTGNRSTTGRDILLAAGFTQTTSMAGGVTQWQALGNPTVSGQ